ncbi:hypothetical protein R1sor_026281 [Riccia sorocarpa]|uniref:G-patch domain-containing protein n=1 Tax=Riccia sorocarpa TaxID=122646 RepID=A0ABD3GAY6_9MARC
MESSIRKKRNYRRRIRSESQSDDDGKDDDDDNDVKTKNYRFSGVNGEDTLKSEQPGSSCEAEKNLTDGNVLNSPRNKSEEDGPVELAAEEGREGAFLNVATNPGAKYGNGGAQNGTRIASGIGFEMLRAMGWTERTGLGQSGNGIVDPILPVPKGGTLGLGFTTTSLYDTQEAIRQVQKAKREERDRKLKHKLDGLRLRVTMRSKRQEVKRPFWDVVLFILHMWLLPSEYKSATGLSLPLSVSSRWIIDASGARVKLACVSWGAHMEAMVAEGLDKQPLSNITGLISSSGFNCVRLTYATYMFTRQTQNGTTVSDSLNSLGLTVAARGIASHNPGLAQLSLVEAYRKVVEAIAASNLLIILDNHVSKPGWCCSDNDGNGFWGDSEFDPSEWLRGLEMVADLALDYSGSVVALGLRNEPRGPRQNARDWRKYIQEGAERVHGVNSEVLIFVSGLNYATDLSFLSQQPLVFQNQSVRGKIVYEVHWYSWTSGGGTYSDPNLNSACAFDVSRVMNSTGFLITPNQGYTSPLVVTEFGFSMNGKSQGDNDHMDCYFSLASGLDLDWALWALQGSYYRRDGQLDYDESYGLLTRSWSEIRNTTFLQRLRGLQNDLPGPSSGVGAASYRALFHPGTGLCLLSDSNSSLVLSSCQSDAGVWDYNPGDGLTLKLKGSTSVVTATAEGALAKLSDVVNCSTCNWVLSGDRGIQFAVEVDGKKLCLDGKSGSAVTTEGCLCLNRSECRGTQVVPTSQWFEFIAA